MLRGEAGRTWDIRCPGQLFELREKLRGKTKWRVDALIAKQIVALLAKAYKVKGCAVKPGKGPLFKGLEACYSAPLRSGDRATMWVKKASHVRSVFHEFYHHLDWVTDHLYDSNDRGGPNGSSLAQDFATRLWNVLNADYTPMPLKVKVHSDSRGVYIDPPLEENKRLRPLGHVRTYHPGTYVHAEFKRVPGRHDYTATVLPWHLYEQGVKDPELWSSVQSQIAAAKPPPPRKTLPKVKETAAQRKRRIKAMRLLAAGMDPDPKLLDITCCEDGCERKAKFKYLDDMWRCGEHHRRRVKFVKNHFKTDVEVKREQIAKLDLLIAKFKEFIKKVEAREFRAGEGWLELGRLVKEGERLGCNMDDVKRGAERTLKKVEATMATVNAKSSKTAKSAKAPKTTKREKSTLKDVAAGIKAGAKSKKAAAPTRKAAGNGWRGMDLKDTAKITLKVKDCPYKGNRAKRWVYRNGMTVEAAVERGASRSDIRWDVAHDYISVR